jgi:hypothetical protein
MLVRNLGAQQLERSGESIADIAKRTGQAERTVISHRTGNVVPSPRARELYRQHYSIDPSAWDVIVTSEAAAATLPTPEKVPESAPAIERIRGQIRDLEALRDSGAMTPKGRLEAERLLQAAYRDLARLEGAHLTERQIIATPHWTRLQERLIAALEAHPLALFDALRAVAGVAVAEGHTDSAEFSRDHGADVRRDYSELVANVERANAALRAALNQQTTQASPVGASLPERT